MLRRLLIFAIAVAASVILVATFATMSLGRRYPAPGTMVSIGTHRLQLYCTGNRAPTVIVETGIGSGWETWGHVVPELARSARVCVYDRSGYGWSDPGSVPATASQQAEELHSLLVNAHVPGPWVLVAHSFGAWIARLFATRFSHELSGLVLVDPSHEDEPRILTLSQRIRDRMPPTGLLSLRPFWEGEKAVPAELRDAPAPFQSRYLVGFSYDQAAAVHRENADFDSSEAEVRRAQFPRDLPLIVISATHILIADGVFERRNVPASPHHVELQAGLAKLSSHGRQIVVHSGHLVQLDRPDVIIKAVRRLLDGW